MVFPPPGTIGPVGVKGSCSHCTPSNDRPSHIPPGTYSDPRTEYGELPEQLISNSYSSDSRRPSAPHSASSSSSYDSSGSQSSRAYSSKSGYSHSANLQPPTGNPDDSLVPLPSYSDLPDRPQTIDYKEIQPIAPKHAGDYSAAGNLHDNSQQASGYETAHRPAGRTPGYDTAQLEALGYADRPVGSGSRDRSNSNDYSSGVGGGSLSSHFGASAPSTSQSYRSQSSSPSAGHSNAAIESSQHEHVPATQQHPQYAGARAHAPTSYSRQLQTRQGYNVRVMASGSYGALPVGEMLRRTPPNPFGNFPRYASPPGAATAYRLR
ncbi:hypothetical protein WR25_14487 [Diploscapter pachys]|uniref:Uncharacterized protein n=1 Tax=Diploscapter pachys TaxID=2018661 RepID=A0A2A2KXN1_9BILA|nr:hypothetical protein WR25_14487 [Diploscapter pachys]